MSEPEKNSGSGFGFTEIIVLVCIIGFLAWVAKPNFIGSHTSSQNACINNLRQIDAAKQQWALENGKSAAQVPTSASLNPYIGRLGNGRDLFCPLNKSKGVAWSGYTGNILAVSVMPTCGNYDATLAAGGKHPASLDPSKQ